MTLERVVKEEDRLLVYWEDELLCSFPSKLFKGLARSIPKGLSKEELIFWLDEKETRRAESYALFLLSRKFYFSSKLAMTLIQKGFSEKSASYVLEKFKRLSYIDDKAGVRSVIKMEISRGWGPYYVRQKLQAKGLDSSLVEIIYTPDVEREVLVKLINKYRSKKKALIPFLQRKGFSYELIRSLIN